MSLFAQPTDAATRHLRSLGVTGPPTPMDPKLTQPAMGVWLVLIVGVAVALRMLLFTLGPALDMDRAWVDAPEAAMTLGPLRTTTLEQADAIVGVPIYPALLSGIETLGLPWHALIGLQILLTSMTVLLVFGLLSKLWHSPMGAMAGAMIVAVHPVFILSANQMLPTSLAGFGLACGLYLVLPRDGRTLAKVAWGGLILGASALVMPVLAGVGPTVALGLMLTSPTLRSVGRTGLAATVLWIASLIGPGAWMAHHASQGLGYHLADQPDAQLFERMVDVHWRAADGPTTRHQVVNDQRQQIQQQMQSTHVSAAWATRLHAWQSLWAHPRIAMSLWWEQVVALGSGASTPAWYASLGLRYESVDPLASLRVGDLAMVYQADPAGAWLTLGQRAISAGLAVASLIAAVILIWRRRWRPVVLLGGLSAYLLLALWVTSADSLRLFVVLLEVLWLASLWTDPPARQPKEARKPRLSRAQRIARSFDQPAPHDADDQPTSDPTQASLAPTAPPTGRPI